MNTNLAIQLYSLRDEVGDDFSGLLKKVKEIGFDGVEFAGFFGMETGDLKKILDDLNLKSMGSHCVFYEDKENLMNLIEYNKILGTKYMVLPWADVKTEDDYLRIADFCDKTGKIVRENGMRFLYHNHDFELDILENGQRGYDILLENTRSENLSFELDLYWVKYAGLNPLEFLKKLGSRCATVHLKDMANTPDKTMTEVGTGIINYKEILEYGAKNNIEWYTIEQDEIFIDRFESIKISHNNVRKMAESI